MDKNEGLGIRARVLTDSVSPPGCRLTTMEVTFPRFLLAQLGTHRMFSRNAASSRAVPTAKLMEQVRQDPVLPVFWGKNQKGMQAEVEMDDWDRGAGNAIWLAARDEMLRRVEHLVALGAHKQVVNRLLEPWLWTTVIVTGVGDAYANFFHLRCDEAAQPEMQALARAVREAYRASEPEQKPAGEWHCPLIQPAEWRLDKDIIWKVSVARCARVSYLTHAGVRDIDADLELYQKLLTSGHWSAFEHVAVALEEPERWANFTGWRSWRSFQPGEYHTEAL